MKIEIEMMDNGISYIQQMEAVDNYIKGHIIKVEKYNYFGEPYRENTMDLVLFQKLTLAVTKKDIGEKVWVRDRNFHVSCKKTNGGTYKFKVWQAT